jgi:hypothetical protein
MTLHDVSWHPRTIPSWLARVPGPPGYCKSTRNTPSVSLRPTVVDWVSTGGSELILILFYTTSLTIFICLPSRGGTKRIKTLVFDCGLPGLKREGEEIHYPLCHDPNVTVSQLRWAGQGEVIVPTAQHSKAGNMTFYADVIDITNAYGTIPSARGGTIPNLFWHTDQVVLLWIFRLVSRGIIIIAC